MIETTWKRCSQDAYKRRKEKLETTPFHCTNHRQSQHRVVQLSLVCRNELTLEDGIRFFFFLISVEARTNDSYFTSLFFCLDRNSQASLIILIRILIVIINEVIFKRLLLTASQIVCLPTILFYWDRSLIFLQGPRLFRWWWRHVCFGLSRFQCCFQHCRSQSFISLFLYWLFLISRLFVTRLYPIAPSPSLQLQHPSGFGPLTAGICLPCRRNLPVVRRPWSRPSYVCCRHVQLCDSDKPKRLRWRSPSSNAVCRMHQVMAFVSSAPSTWR